MIKNGQSPKISNIIRKRLLIILLVTLVIGLLISTYFLHRGALRETNRLLEQSVEDVRMDLADLAEDVLMESAYAAAKSLGSADLVSEAGEQVQEWIEEMIRYNAFSEINLVNRDGIIIASTVPELVGYDMASGEQSAKFLSLLDAGREEPYIQEYDEIGYDLTGGMRYAGMPFPDGSGFLQVGIDQTTLLANYLPMEVRNRHIGLHGTMMIADEDRNVVGSFHDEKTGTLLDPAISLDDADQGIRLANLQEGAEYIPCYVLVTSEEGYYIIGVYPEDEALASANVSITVVLIIDIVIFIVLFLVISWFMRTRVVKGVVDLNQSLSEITAGNLDSRADVRSSEEFASLSDGINTTVDSLKDLIAREAARIDKELAFAKTIQQSALPSVFPPFPARHDFELHAAMFTAKEVGGDFYDFYLLDEKKLAFMVADVSGKGIPAAMFMMRSKSVLRNYAESGNSIEEVFAKANNSLCEGNEADMFVTAWMGILETDTGLVHFANAGHNTPVLIRDGVASYICQKPNLLLASIGGIPYLEQFLQLEKGDCLFLYTDGVTEATDAENNLYGEDRLLQALSGLRPSGPDDCRKVCESVKDDIDRFTGDAPQFDDITMLCVKYV